MSSRIPVLNSPQVGDSVRKKLHIPEAIANDDKSSQPAGRMQLRNRKVLNGATKTPSRPRVRSETVTKHVGKPSTEPKVPIIKEDSQPKEDTNVKTKSSPEITTPAPAVETKKPTTVTKKTVKNTTGRIPTLGRGFTSMGMSPTLIHHDPPSAGKVRDKHSKIPAMRPSFLNEATTRVFRESNPNSPSQSPQRTPKRLSLLQMPFDKENTPPPKAGSDTITLPQSPGLHSTAERRARGTNRSNLPRRATARRRPTGQKTSGSSLTSSSSRSSSTSSSVSEVKPAGLGDAGSGLSSGGESPVLDGTYLVENEGTSVFRDSIISRTDSDSSLKEGIKEVHQSIAATGSSIDKDRVTATAEGKHTCPTVSTLKPDNRKDNITACTEIVCMQVQGESEKISDQNVLPHREPISTTQPAAAFTEIPQPSKETKKKPPPSEGVKNKLSFFTPSSIYSNAPMHGPELPPTEMFPSIPCYRVSVIEPQNRTPTSGLTTLRMPVSRYQSRVVPEPDVIGAVHPVSENLAGAAGGPVYLSSHTDTTTVYHTPTVWPAARPLSLHRSHPSILPPNHPSYLPASYQHAPPAMVNPHQYSYPPVSNPVLPPHPTRVALNPPPCSCNCSQSRYPANHGPMHPAQAFAPLPHVVTSPALAPTALRTTNNIGLSALQDAAADREVVQLTQSLTAAASRQPRNVVNPVASRLDGDLTQQYTFQPIHVPTRTVLQNQGSAFQRILIC